MPRKKKSEDAWAVDLYQPLAGVEDFHRSKAKWRLLLGSNRSGKTLAAAVELVRAVLGRDPVGKYRPTNGFAMIIGLDSDHLGMLWRKLSMPGAFRVPVKKNDSIDKWVEAPPLIPKHTIEHISWRERARAIPHLVTLTTGWQIAFISSLGAIKQGEHYDVVWIDEQISNVQFFWEAIRGLVDIDQQWRAYGFWSATPQKQNPLLWEISKRAAPGSDIEQFQLHISENPFVSTTDKDWFSAILPDRERQVRLEGEFALEAWRIYPQLDAPGVHGVEPFEIPDNWTRYLALDPGTANCATVFGAVPPDGKYLYIYDELLLQNTDAIQWATALAERPDAKKFEAWIIDSRAGRTRSMGAGIPVAKQYMDAAQHYNMRPRASGPLCGFIPGVDNPEARREEVRRCLNAAVDESLPGPALKFFKGKTTKLCHQMQIAQLDENNPTKRMRGEFDLVDALEYLVAARVGFMPKPQRLEEESNAVYKHFLEHHRRRSRSVKLPGILVG